MSKKFRAVRSQIKPKSVRKKRRFKLETGLTNNLLKKLEESMFQERPLLKYILEHAATKSLYDLSLSNTYSTSLAVPQERKQELIDVFSAEITRLLGPDISQKAIKQLDKYYFATTVDHQGPVGNPRYLTSNFLAAMPFFENHDPLLTCQIVLACGNISFDNPSFPRGLIFHMASQTDILESIMAFFGRSVDARPVVYFRPYNMESINEMSRRIRVLCNNGILKTRERDLLISLITNVYSQQDILKMPNFSDQVMKTNAILWKRYFGIQAEKTPELVCLEQEHIVNMLLLKHMQKNTLLNKLLFDSKFHDLMEKYYDGIMGAFSLKDHAGTFLFWALPQGQKYRQQLWRKNNSLIIEDGSYSVELTPEAIYQEITNKHLIPSIALIFTTLCFYYGLRAIGGFNQTTYLTEMKRAFSQTVNDYQGKADVDIPIPTTDLAFSRAILAFLKHPNGITAPASGLDIIMYGNNSTWQEMIASAKKISLENAFYRALPSLYSAYYPKEKQEKELLAITEQDVEKFTGLDKLLYTIPLTP